MDMDFNSMVIGQKVVGEFPGVRNVATRISQNELLHEQYEKPSGKLLLKVTQDVPTNTCRLDYFDRGFWTLTLNGSPFNPDQPIPRLRSVNGMHTTKTLNLIT